MLYSFDVFDTLITRKTATPKGIFSLMQHILQSDENYFFINEFVRNNFYNIRVNAEELARLNYFHGGVEEITLEQIYEAVGTVSFVDSSTKSALINLEKKLEQQCVVAIEENIEELKQLVKGGERVILISDMYLDEESIRSMLVSVDDVFSEINLYVSSRYKKGKWSKGLYYLVRKKENVDFSDWIHKGDNEQSDINVPRSLGIRVQPFRLVDFLPLERKLLEHGECKEDIQLMVGTARNLRIKKETSAAGYIGNSFAGYVLVPYIHWLLEQCRQMDICRLYFIARDGYILKKLADIVIEAWNLNIETRYIYASRRSLRMPAYDGTEEGFRRILAYTNPVDIKSVRAFARTLRMPEEELVKYLPEKFCGPDVRIDYKDVCDIAHYLGKKDDFRQYLLEYHSESKKLAKSYLCQEIDYSDEHFAFVDLNGSGLSAGSIANLMQQYYNGELRTFFYKLDRMGLQGNGKIYNFCPGAYKYDLLLELLCRAMHGQTDSYNLENGRVVPVLSGGEGKALREYGYEEYVSGIEDFCRIYVAELLKNKSPVSLNVSLECLHYAVDTPDEDVLNFFADMPFNRSGRNGELTVFAPKLSKKDIRNIFLLHRGQLDKYYYGANFEYSLLRCSEIEKRKIEFYEKNWSEIYSRFESIFHFSINGDFYQKISKCMHMLSESDDRILIYGAGSFGKALHKALEENNKQIVGWLDKGYKRLKSIGYPVTGELCDATATDFDVVIIAVLDERIVDEIKTGLLRLGVPETKIMCLCDRVADYYYLDM